MAAQYSFVMKGLTKAFPGQQAHPQRHPPAILPGCEDRHRRPQRLRQVDADEDHGRPRQGIHRRGLAGRGDHRRLSRAGAAARSRQDGHGECQGRGAPGRRHARPLQRDQRADGRPGRRFRRADGRDGRAAGEDRRGRRLDARQPARDRDGRAALPAGRFARSTTCQAARSAASRSLACCSKSPASCCSTSRPTTSTPKASSGSKSIWSTIPATSSSSPTTAISSTMSSTGSWSSIAGATTSMKETTPPIWKRRRNGSSRKSGRKPASRKRSPTSWNGSAARPRRARPSPRRASRRSTSWSKAQENRAPAKGEILIQMPERLGGKVIEVKGLTKAYGDKLLFENLSFTCRRAGSSGSSAPTAPARHLVQADHRAGAARLRRGRGRPDRAPRLRRPEPRRAQPQAQCVGGGLRRARHHQDRQARD